jgi:molecular chaperone DnaK (HSP70)
MKTARYVVGIDLGTTNCAAAYAEVSPADEGAGAPPVITPFPIVQVTSPGEVDARPTLPSFLLLPTPVEVPPEAMTLPWAASPDFAVGTMARERGADLPTRLVFSAKSWLSHGGVDRRAPILPWRGVETSAGAAASPADDAGEAQVRSVSPTEASALYLAHIRAAWNHAHPDAKLEDQEVLLTVPASFDTVARELTVAAARDAGLANVVLLEEPQAAFYSWLASSGDQWRQRLRPGDVVLVCDVGGGTTDFSIIAAVDDGSGNLTLERLAVGEHILLGGDNMDLALAAMAGDKLSDLSPHQRRGLVHACRQAKERLLSADAPDKVPVSVLGRGSRIIGRAARVDLAREEVVRLCLDGFFPEVPASTRPERRRNIGLREIALPYAHDPGITRHLAEFLGRHGHAPTAILFNGGVMKGDRLRARVADVVGGWYQRAIPTLTGTDLDLAVAHGAAYYGLVRHGRGIRIRGGTARSYYIGIQSVAPAIPGVAPPVKALCVAPFGMEEGTSVALRDIELGLVVGETAEFRFFDSTHRQNDKAGALVDAGIADLEELGPVEATLPGAEGTAPGDVVPVTLAAHLTEVGTLELYCQGRGDLGRWKLEYSIRGDAGRKAS